MRAGAVFTIFACAAVAGCSTSSNSVRQISFPAVVEGGASEIACATTPTNHVLSIDRRGWYQPISFETGPCRNRGAYPDVDVLRQPGAIDEEAACAALLSEIQVQHGAPLASLASDPDKTANHRQLICHIENIVRELERSARMNEPKHLLIYLHGGLNSHSASLGRAVADAPVIASWKVDDPQISGRSVFPLFINWPSGGIDAFIDQSQNYAQGEYDDPVRRAATPAFIAGDIGQTLVRAPADWFKSLLRFSHGRDSKLEYYEEWGCAGSRNVGCSEFESEPSRIPRNALYAATFPFRLLSVPMTDTGKGAWKNMVARTRFATRRYVSPEEYQALDTDDDVKRKESTDLALRPDGETRENLLTKGPAWWLLERLSRSPYLSKPSEHKCSMPAIRITVIGHSMGSMVANEMIREFPNLPYQNIVFMAGAASIRDFKSAVEPVLRQPLCDDLRFYNLSLHPKMDARELTAGGLMPSGSLLEWIDDIFEEPTNNLDRTIGKWRNIVMAASDFDREAARRIFLHRFGRGGPGPTTHGAFDDVRLLPTNDAPSCTVHPYWHPKFWRTLFENLGDDCRPKGRGTELQRIETSRGAAVRSNRG